MFGRLASVEGRYVELEERMGDPAVAGDHAAFTKLNRELASMRPVVEGYRRWVALNRRREESLELLREGDARLPRDPHGCTKAKCDRAESRHRHAPPLCSPCRLPPAAPFCDGPNRLLMRSRALGDIQSQREPLAGVGHLLRRRTVSGTTVLDRL